MNKEELEILQNLIRVLLAETTLNLSESERNVIEKLNIMKEINDKQSEIDKLIQKLNKKDEVK